MMRRFIIVGICGILAGSSGNAQQPTSTPTFRTGTTLVDFTFVAVDEKGKPVTDLRKDEISIVEDDQSREVAFFEFLGRTSPGTIEVSRTPLSSGTFTNRTEYAPGAPRNVIAVVLDFVNADTLVQQFELRAQFLHYLRQIPADAQLALYVVREQAVAVHDLTHDVGTLRSRLEGGELDVFSRALATDTDMRALLSNARPEHVGALTALAEANTRAVRDFNIHIMRARRRTSLSALDSVGTHLAGLPGRKSLVWVTHGFPLLDMNEGNHTDEVRATSRRLASYDVAVYPVDAAGLQVERGNIVERERYVGTTELIASITGGHAARHTNDLTAGISVAAEDIRGAYAIGFYADTPNHQWRLVAVTASRPGVRIRHRQGHLIAPAMDNPKVWGEAEWNELAYRLVGSTDLRMDVRATFVDGTLKTFVDIPRDDLQFTNATTGPAADIDIAVVERTAKGPTNVRVESASLAPGTAPVIRVGSTFALNSQTQSVRLIVRDKSTGRYGTVDLTLSKVPRQ